MQQSLIDLIGPIGSVMWVVALLFMPLALAISRFYRERWLELTMTVHAAGLAGGIRPLRQARGAEWVCDRLDALLRWSYYVIGGAALVNIVFVPPLPGAEGPKIPLWIVLFAFQIAAVAMLIAADHNRDDHREVGLRRILHAADDSFSSRHGLRVRDDLTGLHSTEFWIRGLELLQRRMIFKGTPITCLVLQIGGLKEHRKWHGDEAADHVLVRAASVLKNNVKSGSLICRFESASFAVALFRCPKKRGLAVGENLVANIRFEVLDWIRDQHGVELEIFWASAIMPGDASTPVELLRTAEWKLKQRVRASRRSAVEKVPFDPEEQNGKPPAAA
ncbi:MAG: GGDEF domain-containing protein [Anaerolineales bacterium]